MEKALEELELDQSASREQTNYGISISAFLKDTIHLKLSYQESEYCELEMQLLLRKYKKIVTSMIEYMNQPVDQIYCVDEEERTMILEEFNHTDCNYPQDKTVLQLFEEQVERTPNQIAIRFEEEELTYEQLNMRAGELAKLLNELGVGPDQYVAILAERSIEMMVAIYGVMKAGGAYVPIDPTYPKDRIKYIHSP